MTCLVIEAVRYEESDDHRQSSVESLYSEWVGSVYSGRKVYVRKSTEDTVKRVFECPLHKFPSDPIFQSGWTDLA